MATQIPPPQAPKSSNKAGWGCVGCGCAVVLVVVLLVVGLIVAGGYMGFKALSSLASPEPASIAAFTGGEDIYASAQKKLDAFNQDVSAGKASTLTLTNDEVNALIAHNSDLTRLQVHLAATLTGDQAQLQGSIPTNSLPFVGSVVKDRYYNFDATFSLTFDSGTKRLGADFHKLQIGGKPIPDNALQTMDLEMAPWILMMIEHYPDAKRDLAAAQTVEIKGGQLVVETK